uniref:Uncharacterized protein n=1 Tax=Chromera velia CCMP2878 TaxID=1169474 RepID=A0A0G4HMP4_9ALVE|eukprot:Cvel_1189.t1-p1 / transcript=Cvel_1189.t1 / gene=Cvel_1189 / organism=Chromera_velia_CCMP2878 / gene_product=hypothetical protein / transcript_product=hypothetical protein / location=Cvel_scaffold39:128021-128359(-) / protein_length=113 / sequence_SO=supercontig / SO=protein_coding / is_pseudo=false
MSSAKPVQGRSTWGLLLDRFSRCTFHAHTDASGGHPVVPNLEEQQERRASQVVPMNVTPADATRATSVVLDSSLRKEPHILSNFHSATLREALAEIRIAFHRLDNQLTLEEFM